MSTLVTNTITGLSTAANITIGSTPVVSASANSLTIRGEGSNQTSIQQGIAKSWVNFNGGTAASRDSHNVASLTDIATGNFTVNFTNNMSSANYSIAGAGGSSVSNNSLLNVSAPAPEIATSGVGLDVTYVHGTADDAALICASVFGDLS